MGRWRHDAAATYTAYDARMSPVHVFLSSTCYDLQDLRFELANHLRAHAFEVSQSDDYESAFRVDPRLDSVTSCLLAVERADVVVCVLDRRYGPPLPEEHAYAGRSATHAELLFAKEKSKRVFTFVRDTSLAEHQRILADGGYEPCWMESNRKECLAQLIADQRRLSDAVSQKRSNWFDQFRTSVDLKPLILKRLLDEFPEQASSFAMRADRLVRLYFQWKSAKPDGTIVGSFVNVGNGPALDVKCGWRIGQNESQCWHTQGGVAVGGEIGSKDHSGALAFSVPWGQEAVVMYCEYGTASGDRFRVEAPVRITHNGYVREGPEQFFVWIGNKNGGWRRAA